MASSTEFKALRAGVFYPSEHGHGITGLFSTNKVAWQAIALLVGDNVPGFSGYNDGRMEVHFPETILPKLQENEIALHSDKQPAEAELTKRERTAAAVLAEAYGQGRFYRHLGPTSDAIGGIFESQEAADTVRKDMGQHSSPGIP